MAANNDFFVRFGSDAGTWAAGLDAELAPARDAIGVVHKLLNNLEITAKNNRAAASAHLTALAAEAVEVQKKLNAVNASAGKAGTGHVDPDEGRVRGLVSALSDFTATFSEMHTKLARTVDLIGRAGEEIQEARISDLRSQRQKEGATTQTQTGHAYATGARVGDIDKATNQVIRAWNKAGQEIAKGVSVAGQRVSAETLRQRMGLGPDAPLPGVITREQQIANSGKRTAAEDSRLAAAIKTGVTEGVANAAKQAPTPTPVPTANIQPQVQAAVKQAAAEALKANPAISGPELSRVIADTTARVTRELGGGGEPEKKATPAPVAVPPAEQARIMQQVADQTTAKHVQPVQLQNIPQMTIDEASFERVVKAVERNVTATQRVEAAVNRLAGHLGAPDAPDDVDPKKAAAAVTELNKAQRSELADAFREELAMARETDRKVGPEARESRDAVWQDLVTRQMAALSAGNNLITPERRAEMDARKAASERTPDQRRSDKNLERLKENFKNATDEANRLGREVESLSQRMQAGEDVAAQWGRTLQQFEQARDTARSKEVALNAEETRAQERMRNQSWRRIADQKRRSEVEEEFETPEERDRRRQTLGALALAADPEMLKAATGRDAGKLGKRELMDLADTLSRQGYPTPYKPVDSRTGITRSTMDELRALIGASGAEYLKGGSVTDEDLSPRRMLPQGQTSERVTAELEGSMRDLARSVESSLLKVHGRDIGIKDAYDLLGQNRATGGSEPGRIIDPSSVPGAEARKAGRTKGRAEVGAAIGDELRELPLLIDDAKREYREAREKRSRYDIAGKLETNPNYNPRDLLDEIEGNGEQQKADRRDARSYIQASDEIDNFARGLVQLEDELDRARRFQSGVNGALNAYHRGLEKGERRDPARERDLAEKLDEADRLVDRRLTTLSQRMAGAQEFLGGRDPNMLLQPTFREGIRRRDEERTGSSPLGDGEVYSSAEVTYLAEQKRRAEIQSYLEDRENRKAVVDASRDQMGRAKTYVTEQGNSRDFYSRALPGFIRQGDRLEYEFPEQFETPEDKRRGAKARAKVNAGDIGYASALANLTKAVSEGVRDEKVLDELREKLVRALNKLMVGYQMAFPTAPSLDPRSYLPANLGDTETTSAYPRVAGFSDEALERFSKVLEQSRVAQAGRDQIVADAEAAYNDPKRAGILQKQNAAALKAEADRLTAEIRNTTDPKDRERLETRRDDVQRQRREVLGTFSPEDLHRREQELAEEVAKQRILAKAKADAARKLVAAETALAAIEERTAARRAATEALEHVPRAKPGDTEQGVFDLLQDEIDETKRNLKRVNDEMIDADRTGGITEYRIDDDGNLQQVEGNYDDLERQRIDLARQLSELESQQRALNVPSVDRDNQPLSAERVLPAGQGRGVVDPSKSARVPGPSTLDTALAEDAALQAEREKQIKAIADNRDKLRDATNNLQLQDAEVVRNRQALRAMNAAFEERESKRGDKSYAAQTTRAIERTEARLAVVNEKLAVARDDAAGMHQKTNPTIQRLEAAQSRLQNVLDQRRTQLSTIGAAGGAGGVGGGDGALPVPGTPGGDGPDDILRRILAEVIRVNQNLKGTLKVRGSVSASGDVTESTGTGRLPRSSEAGRREFEERISAAVPEIGKFIAAQDDVAAATEMVRRGLASETAVLDHYRDKLGQTTEQARQFKAQVRASVGDAKFADVVAAAESQKQKESAKRFDLRGGGEMHIDDARAEMATALADQKKTVLAETAKAKAAREAALIGEQQAAVLRKLTPATQKEVAELERLAIASRKGAASQADLAKQMAKVHGMMRNDLGVGRADEARTGARRVFEGVGIKTSGAEMDEVARTSKSMGYEVDRAAAAGVMPGGLFGEQSLFTQAMFGGHGFWSRMMASTGTFVVRNFAAGFVFGLTAGLQQVIAQALETERTFVRVSHALEATGRSSTGLRRDLAGVATEYGTNLNDVYTIAAGLTGLFDTNEELVGATEVVAQLQMISGGALNAQEAMGALASIQGAFSSELGVGVGGLQKVADVLTSVQNNVGTNVEVTAEAVGRMSGLANQIGLTYEETAVYGAQIAKLTNQTGAAAGEQFSRILSAMQTGRGRSALAENFAVVRGEETGIESLLGARDYSGVLKVMQEEWRHLSEVQQQNVAVSIAGQRQAASFAALMNSGQKTLNAIAKAENSYGDALARTEELMKTLQNRLDRLGSELQDLMSNLLQSGLLDWLGLIVVGLTKVLHGANALFGFLNEVADSNPVVDFATRASFALLGFLAVMALLRRSWAGLKATLNSTQFAQGFQQAGQRPLLDPITGRPVASNTGGTYDRMRQNFAARGDRFLYATTGGDQRPGNVGAPLNRAFGRGLDVVLGRPLEAAGRSATRFSNSLIRRSSEIAQDAALQAARTGQYDQGAVNRGVQVGRAGQAVGTFGAGLGAFGAGARDVFQGRGALRFQGISEDLKARAERYGIAAQFAKGSDDPNARRQARSYMALSRAADLGARATSRVGASFAALGQMGMAADAALMALTIGIGAMLQSASEEAKVAGQIKNYIEGREEDRGGADKPVDPYEGPAREIYDEATKVFTREGTDAGRVWAYVGRALSNPLESREESFEAITGTDDGFVYGRKAASDRYQRLSSRLAELGESSSTTIEDITAFQIAADKEFAAAEKALEEDEDISEQQRAGGFAMEEAARQILQSEVERIIANVEGLRNVGLLELEQLARLGEATTALVPIQGNELVLDNLRSGLNALAGEAGIGDSNPEIQAALDRLLGGGLSAADAAREQTTILTEAAKQAQIKYLAALEANNDPEDLETKRQAFLAAMNQLASITEQNVQTFVQNATLFSEQAFALGNYDASQRILRQAIKDIEAQKPKGIVTTNVDPSTVRAAEASGRELQIETNDPIFTEGELARRAKFEADQRALVQQDIERMSFERNRTLQIEATQTQSEVSSAVNAVTQARNVLRAMREARARHGDYAVTKQQIHNQRLALLQAEEQEARARVAEAAAKRETTVSLIAPGDQVGRAEQALVNAGAGVADAEQFGKDSVQYQSALQQMYAAQDAVDVAVAGVRGAWIQLGQAFAEADGDAVGAAQAGVDYAKFALAIARAASGGADTQDTIAAEQALVAAEAASERASEEHADVVTGLAIARANSKSNVIRAARLEVRRIGRALSNAEAGTTEWEGLRTEMTGAAKALRDAVLDDEIARFEYLIARAEADGNLVLAARLRQKLTDAAMEGVKKGTAAWNRLRTQAIGEAKALEDTIQDSASAQIEMLTAIAQARGDTVRVAELAHRGALLAQAGVKPGSAEWKRMEAQVVSTNADIKAAHLAETQAQIGVLQAMADSRGDAVASAFYQTQAAQAALDAATPGTEDYYLAQAQVIAGNAASDDANMEVATSRIDIQAAMAESMGDSIRVARLQAASARIAMSFATAGTAEWNSAKAQLIAANAAIGDAQVDLLQSRIGVSIALAEAAGNDVKVAELQMKAAQAALRAATPGTAEYNAARAELIGSRAGVRDAVLQDQLDTIDFNLEMGRMTQSAAISALRQILRTSDLTRDQRRQLLLQIKGMEEEMSSGPWNFGDIKLPKPYLMKRFIEEQREANGRSLRDELDREGRSNERAVRGMASEARADGSRARASIGTQYNDHRNVEIKIMGGDEQRVRKIIREEVGRPGRTRTPQSRRGRR